MEALDVSHALKPLIARTTDGQDVSVWQPEYADASICRTIPTVLSLLDFDFPGLSLLAARDPVNDILGSRRSFRGAFVILLDGFSFPMLRLLQRKWGWPFGDNSNTYGLSAVFPSETQACIPAIWSSLPPGMTGQFGRSFFVPELASTTGPIFRHQGSIEYGLEQEALADDSLYEEAMAFPTWASMIRSTGAQLNPYMTLGFKAFTRRAYRGFEPFIAGSPESNAEHLDQVGGRLSGSYISTDTKLLRDGLNHVVSTSTASKQILFYHLMSFQRAARVISLDDPEFLTVTGALWDCLLEVVSGVAAEEDWVVIITADHGSNVVDAEQSVVIPERAVKHLERLSYTPPARNSRGFYLYPRDDRSMRESERVIADYCPPGSCAVIPMSDTEMRCKLFGPVADRYSPRVGELLVLNVGHGNMYMWDDPPHGQWNLATHGGLTADELMVPFVAIYQK